MTRLGRITGLALFGSLVAGCYSLQPVRGTPPVGAQVAFDVNDAGRVALGGQIGPEIGQIEGRLLRRDSGEYALAVSAVRMLRGGEQVWSGETVRLRPEHLGNAYERRFSKGRTVVLGLALVGGVVAFAVTRDLFGLGSDPEIRPPRDTGNVRLIPKGTSLPPLWRLNFRGVHP
jgi:hypothetical protein